MVIYVEESLKTNPQNSETTQVHNAILNLHFSQYNLRILTCFIIWLLSKKNKLYFSDYSSKRSWLLDYQIRHLERCFGDKLEKI